MRIDVLLFAQIADDVGRDRLTLELDDDARVADAIDRLAGEHASIASLRDCLAFAVDESYCTPDTTLADGQTLALIPPVSGG
jgi:molybdopterin converting factor subunit 1